MFIKYENCTKWSMQKFSILNYHNHTDMRTSYAGMKIINFVLRNMH